MMFFKKKNVFCLKKKVFFWLCITKDIQLLLLVSVLFSIFTLLTFFLCVLDLFSFLMFPCASNFIIRINLIFYKEMGFTQVLVTTFALFPPLTIIAHFL